MENIPIWEKFNLTINEASEYFNVGTKKLRQIIENHANESNTFVIQNGTKVLINRRKFENFMDKTSSI